MDTRSDLIDLTAEIVSAYVGNNMLRSTDLPQLIQDIHTALNEITSSSGQGSGEPQKPAVNPKRSVHPDYIVCLEDGLKFKSLKRHIRTKYDLTPDAYRRKWGLQADYPMVAPNYAKARSALAKKMGLGRKPRQRRR
jgi:predicted transcriptional regulator